MNLNRVTVIGGGNIGTQFACVCAAKGCDVTVFSSKPEAFDGILEIVDENDKAVTGKIVKATKNIAEALDGCQVVFVTHPASQLKKLADQMVPYIKNDVKICVLPGTGGAEFAFRECVKAGAFLYGLQRVPTVSRLEKYGKRVRCEGLRNCLYLASIPIEKAEEFAAFISELFCIPCKILPNYLSVTLTPSNPILHTTRLRTLFSDYAEGKVYAYNPLFYGEWSDASSELLLACDEELQKICRALSKLDLTYVRSLRCHYESNTVPALTAKMRSIQSLHNLSSPMKQVEGGWIPDFTSRYFTADFPFGLAIIEELANLAGTDASNIRDTMDWYRGIVGNTSGLELSDYGITSLDDLYKFYE